MRFTDGLRDRIAKVATDTGRSMNDIIARRAGPRTGGGVMIERPPFASDGPAPRDGVSVWDKHGMMLERVLLGLAVLGF